MYIHVYYILRIYFIVPLLVQITPNETLSNLTVSDPLTLDCTVTTVSGISSSIDIIWTIGGRVVRRINNIMADVENISAVYTDSFIISSLSPTQKGKVYQCTAVINATPQMSRADQITLNFIGELINIYIRTYVRRHCLNKMLHTYTYP